MQGAEIVYQSETITASFRSGSSPWTLVSFEGAGLIGRLNDQSQREFIDQSDLSAVVISARRRSWYPLSQTLPCIEAVRKAIGDKDIISYGASMGGYAAIKYAAVLKARHVVALAPQFSIDPKVIRLKTDPFVSNFRSELNSGMEITSLDVACPVDIVFDPTQENDREHVELIYQQLECRLTPTRFAGHALEVLFTARSDLSELIRFFWLTMSSRYKTLFVVTSGSAHTFI